MIIQLTEYNSWDKDPDKGEELISRGLIWSRNELSDDFVYVKIALSQLINNFGINYCQQIIDDICNKSKEAKLIFVCQHIFVNKINWGKNSIVFSTHSEFGSDIHPIHHYSAIYDTNKIREERDILFSFIGHCGTHPIREKLVKLYPKYCFSTEGVWMSKKYKNKYIDLLGSSVFSLCPRGTGVSSMRLYEALSMKSIPVIISDELNLPLDWYVNWDNFSIKIREDEVDNIEEILSSYSGHIEELKQMSKKGQQFWEKYCSDDNLYKIIIQTLKK